MEILNRKNLIIREIFNMEKCYMSENSICHWKHPNSICYFFDTELWCEHEKICGRKLNDSEWVNLYILYGLENEIHAIWTIDSEEQSDSYHEYILSKKEEKDIQNLIMEYIKNNNIHIYFDEYNTQIKKDFKDKVIEALLQTLTYDDMNEEQIALVSQYEYKIWLPEIEKLIEIKNDKDYILEKIHDIWLNYEISDKTEDLLDFYVESKFNEKEVK